MRILDLFCGTKSITNVFAQAGWETTTLDSDIRFNPDICADIMLVEIKEYFDVVWASPPCTSFSVASIGRHWKHNQPSKEAITGNKLLAKTLELINIIRPRYWFIENPRGMMRTLPIMSSLPRKTVTYCQCGDTRMKPTDIWTNCKNWDPIPACKNGDNCHIKAPRGSRTGTQGLNSVIDRAIIPEKLCREILLSVEQKEG